MDCTQKIGGTPKRLRRGFCVAFYFSPPRPAHYDRSDQVNCAVR